MSRDSTVATARDVARVGRKITDRAFLAANRDCLIVRQIHPDGGQGHVPDPAGARSRRESFRTVRASSW
ncbi:hypothetical protein GCM10010321_53240 [Streptomyces chartreusis]|nr:hypothetical protein GCM10010321_53240 [Streptomyces chartreusis]